jgi:hypothetical protein
MVVRMRPSITLYVRTLPVVCLLESIHNSSQPPPPPPGGSRDVNLTDLHLVPRLSMSGFIPLRPLYALMVWTRTTLLLTSRASFYMAYNNNNNKLQIGRHPVAVIVLHITYARTVKFDNSRFS